MTDMEETTEDQTIVLVNDEEQHSLWPAYQAVPAGWRQVFGPDTKSACLHYVTKSWPDITPLSVRRAAATRS
jgi:MbtH protein